MPLRETEIEAELSYAYLHAVAAKAGMSCKVGSRHDDNAGIDVEVNYRGPTRHPYFTDVQLNIQIKATYLSGGKQKDYSSYFFQGADRYNRLCKKDGRIDKFLVVLFLPKDPIKWLDCKPAELIMRKAAYWINLYGANPCTNARGQTVHLPKSNLLTPDSLTQLVNFSVTDTIPPYATYIP